ncbi:MAG: MEDS domain-containing protein [Prolixibacteraceae bacterium]
MHLSTSKQEKLELGFGNYSCNWGIHIAGLYETTEERDAIIHGFMAKGIENEDLQLYSPAEQTAEEFKQNFVAHCPECKEKSDNQKYFIIYPPKDLYFPDGTFSPAAMDTGLNKFYRNSQKHGKRNVRAAAEMIWGLGAIPGVEHLMAYEARLNYFITGKPWISICMYNTRKFSGSVIINVLKTHPYIFNGGVLMQNPYYEDPAKWLSENAPQFLPG